MINKIYSERIYNSSNENLEKVESLLENEKYEDVKNIILKLQSSDIIEMILNIDFHLVINNNNNK